MRFRIAAAVVALAVVVGIVAIFNWSSHETRRLVDQLNARYVEKIEIENVAGAGGGRKDLILIDGLARYDCSEEGGWLTCSDDPQPTRE